MVRGRKGIYNVLLRLGAHLVQVPVSQCWSAGTLEICERLELFWIESPLFTASSSGLFKIPICAAAAG